MPFWLLMLFPVLSAVIGWAVLSSAIHFLFHPRQPRSLFGCKIQGLLPKRQASMAVALGKLANKELFSFSAVSEKLTSPENIRQLTPFIEEHIDHFLRVKLKETMPMISMFIGDKTITQLKTVFLDELQQLFPIIMEKYAGNLQDQINLEQIVTDKIAKVPAEQLESMLRNGLTREIRWLKILGALLGFTIGLLQVILTIITNN